MPTKRSPRAPKASPGASPARTRGRPTALNDRTANAIINAVRAGTPLHRAAAFAGIHDETLRKWRRQGEAAELKAARSRTRPEQRLVEFVGALDQALAHAAVRFQAIVYEIGTDPDVDARTRLHAATWYLSHREQDDYAARQEHTGADGGPIEHEMSGDAAFAALLGIQQAALPKEE